MFLCDVSHLKISDQEKCKLKISKDFHYSSTLQHLESWIFDQYGLSRESYYILCNGKKVSRPTENVEGKVCCWSGPDVNIIHVVPKTLGGKGGFGSMLRAIGAQIEKTTNREACRDLSGRRLRDINEEKRLKNWIAQQADREREASERKKKKLQRLCQEPKHDFEDKQYVESRSAVADKMSNSIEQGFKASTSGVAGQKRKSDSVVNKSVKKKKTLWIDVEDSNSSDSISESEEGIVRTATS